MIDPDKEPCDYCGRNPALRTMPYCCEAQHHVTMARREGHRADETITNITQAAASLRTIYQRQNPGKPWPSVAVLVKWAAEVLYAREKK